MERQVMVVELGMGVDLRGQDPTKAAVRAVRDAIGRVTLPGLRLLTPGVSGRPAIRVRLAVPPEAGTPDLAAVQAALPHGEAAVEIIPGGMLTPSGLDDGGMICVVVAAVEVGLEAASPG